MSSPPTLRLVACCCRNSRGSAGANHPLFEENALRAETDDMADLAILTAQTLAQCLAFHPRFRAD